MSGRLVSTPKKVSIPKRASEALNRGIAVPAVQYKNVSIPKRASEALNR